MRRSGAIALAGAGALVLFAATPAAAANPVSQASGSALTINLAGRTAGSGEFVAEHDGESLKTIGTNTPALPVLDQQEAVIGGALGQDAIAKADGTSESCAGLVGRNGTVEVGPHGGCLTEGDGRIVLSLGSLDALGIGDLLGDAPDLPELPTPDQLPAMELRIEGNAIAANCQAEPGKAVGRSSIVAAEVVAVVSGQRVPIADIPPDGLTLSLEDVLDQLPEVPGLGGVLGDLLDQLPELPGDDLSTDLLSITTDEQLREQTGKLHVTALRVAAGPEALLDVRVGKASCGPNIRNVGSPTRTPTPTATPTPGPEPTDPPTAVPAGLASTSGEGSSGAYGLGTIALIGLAGLALGGYLHRLRGSRSASSSMSSE